MTDFLAALARHPDGRLRSAFWVPVALLALIVIGLAANPWSSAP